ncbi:hypothetical protein CSPX01_05990 [Colletotrichum filicis]|nr:hypothetical protein CSPX01_05990 [Colletotrichum filicis]
MSTYLSLLSSLLASPGWNIVTPCVSTASKAHKIQSRSSHRVDMTCSIGCLVSLRPPSSDSSILTRACMKPFLSVSWRTYVPCQNRRLSSAKAPNLAWEKGKWICHVSSWAPRRRLFFSFSPVLREAHDPGLNNHQGSGEKLAKRKGRIKPTPGTDHQARPWKKEDTTAGRVQRAERGWMCTSSRLE